ncbi:MAG: LamG domain-containing protein [Verrucomicrobiales bacterium]|nr:LamG domain-containing protein [Verrucomicrobiales bacterium]
MRESLQEEPFTLPESGQGKLGYWGLPLLADDPWFAIRNLNGAIDEFAIFSAALTAEKIEEMYENGKP